MKRLILLTTLTLKVCSAISQQVFFEDFSTCSNTGVTTSGSDNIGGVNWSTTCPSSIAGTDYFRCQSGQLEARDTNGEAVWSTGPIDISSCVGSQISFTLSEVGTMEECNGTSCNNNCIDFVKVEYNLDGAGWQQFGFQTCPAGLTAGNNHIQIGDISGGGPINYVSECIDFGSNVEFRITCMCWAGSEYWRFDNISVDCNDCVLSVQILDIKAEREGRAVKLNWKTATEFNNERWEIERSVNGYEWEVIGEVAGAGDTSSPTEYSFTDQNAYMYAGETVYYRVRQFDYDGKNTYSKARSVKIPAFKVFYNNETRAFSIRTTYNSFELDSYTFNIYDVSGQLIHSSTESGDNDVEWSKSGFYILEIPELNMKQKVIVP